MFSRFTYPFLILLLFPLSMLSAFEQNANPEHEAFTVVTYDLQTNVSSDSAKQTETFLRHNSVGLKALLKSKPDVVNLQGIPLGGIQWLKKGYGSEYGVIYASKRETQSEQKKNDYLAILYKKQRYELLEKDNFTPGIRTKYFKDRSGNLVLMAEVKDKIAGKAVTLVNSSLSPDLDYLKRQKEAEELILYLQKYQFAVVAGNLIDSSNSSTMDKFARYAFVADPITESTLAASDRKSGTILYKGSGRSRFFKDQCRLEREISGSAHLPLSCRILLR